MLRTVRVTTVKTRDFLISVLHVRLLFSCVATISHTEDKSTKKL
jgi:hypothetical protein